MSKTAGLGAGTVPKVPKAIAVPWEPKDEDLGLGFRVKPLNIHTSRP